MKVQRQLVWYIYVAYKKRLPNYTEWDWFYYHFEQVNNKEAKDTFG